MTEFLVVMIVVFQMGIGQNSTTHVYFEDMESCEAAKAAIDGAWREKFNARVWVSCFERGKE